jgi:hypothetical protein
VRDQVQLAREYTPGRVDAVRSAGRSGAGSAHVAVAGEPRASSGEVGVR